MDTEKELNNWNEEATFSHSNLIPICWIGAIYTHRYLPECTFLESMKRNGCVRYTDPIPRDCPSFLEVVVAFFWNMGVGGGGKRVQTVAGVL